MDAQQTSIMTESERTEDICYLKHALYNQDKLSSVISLFSFQLMLFLMVDKI